MARIKTTKTQKTRENAKGKTEFFHRCNKCGGSGQFVDWNGWVRGRCFACAGQGGEWLTERQEATRAKSRARYAKKKAAREQIAQDVFEANLAADPDLKKAFECEDSRVQDILSRFKKYGSISAKQIAFVKSVAGVGKEELKAGRRAIQGVIVSVKANRHGDPCFLLEEDETHARVFGPCLPEFTDYVKGDWVLMTATIEVSRKDRFFGFFSDPVVGNAEATAEKLAEWSESDDDFADIPF